MKKKFLGVILVSSFYAAAAGAAWIPDRPIEFVVTAGAGGGTDSFARIVQSAIVKYKLVNVPIVVVNKGGGSGAEGYVYGASNPTDPFKVTFGTNNEYLLPLVAKMGFGPESFVPVASMAMDEFVLWVNGESAIKDAKGYVEAAKKPGGLKMGGSQSKDVDQTLTSMITATTGGKFAYVPYKSGSEAAVQLSGNHIDSNVNNPSESLGQWKAGLVKPICVFGSERMAKGPKVAKDMAWSDIPLCKDSGIPIAGYQMPRTVWLPANVSADIVDFYVTVMNKVRETPEWKQYIERTSQTDQFLTGNALRAFIKTDSTRASEVFKREGWALQ